MHRAEAGPAIVIADRGNPDATVETCRVVRATTKCHVLVTHDGASPDAFASLRTMPGIESEAHVGADYLSRLNAACARLAPHDVVRVDPGVVHLSHDWLTRLQESAAAHASVGVVGAKIFADERQLFSTGRRLVSTMGGRPHHSNVGWKDSDGMAYKESGLVDSVSPAVVYLTRALIERVGTYDSGYAAVPSPLWIEQDDLCLRAWAAGLATVRAPLAAARYRGHTFEDAERAWRDGGAGRVRWQHRWGWNLEFPDLHRVRSRWQGTLVCRDIADTLLDTWPTHWPEVDILLTTKNRRERLETLIPQLTSTDYPGVTLYVFNDGSSDGTREYVESLQGTLEIPVHLVNAPVSVGIHAGLNWLVSMSTSPIVVRLDDEVTLPAHWLRTFVDTLRAHPYAGVVGGTLCAEELPDVVMNADTRWFPAIACHSGETDVGQVDYVSRVSVIFGSCLVYRRKAVLKAGPFAKLEDDMHHVLLTQLAGYDALFDGRVKVLHPNKPMPLRAHRLTAIRRQELLETYGHDVYEVLDTALDLAGRRFPGTGTVDPEECALRDRIGTDPVAVSDGLALARCLARAGRRAESVSWLNAVVAAHPHDQGSRLQRARHFLDAGDLPRAHDDLDAAGDSPATRLLEARVLFAERRFDDAESALAKTPDDDGGEGDALRGALALARGNAQGAADLLERSLAASPSFFAAMNLAMAGHTLKDARLTRTALAEALRIEPSAPGALALHRARYPLDTVTCFDVGSAASPDSRLKIVFWMPPDHAPSGSSCAAQPRGAGRAFVSLAEALASRGHDVRVFGTSHVAGALPGVAWQRPETMPSACLTTPPDVLVCTRSVEWIAQQRFAAVQVAWVEGTLSLALMRHLAAPASLGGIDFWVLPLADQAEAFRTRYGLSPARFLPCESAHHDAGGEGAETDARCWERMLRELLAGETTLVQRVVQHLAARRAAVAHRIVTSEPRPPALSEATWERLQRFVAWHAGQQDRPADNDVAMLVRALGPLRRRIVTDRLWVGPC